MAPQLARHALGRLPTPPPLPENLLSDCTENCPLRPCEHPGGSESENRPATRGTAHSEVQGDARCTARCNVRPIAALHFLPPTGDSRSGRRSLIPNISLLPLDEVPVHVPLRRPRPLRFERLRVGGEGKADANLTNFLSTCCAWHPNSPARPGEAPHPAPSARKSATRTAQKNC